MIVIFDIPEMLTYVNELVVLVILYVLEEAFLEHPNTLLGGE